MRLKRLSRNISIILAAVAVVSASLSAFAGKETAKAKVVVYYFHGAFRCSTCTTLENYSKEAVETNFKDALASGRLEFRAVNVEERGNEHFVSDYKFYTKSLILSLVIGGKEVKTKNLTRIWDYVRDKQGFIDYVTAEVKSLLQEAQ